MARAQYQRPAVLKRGSSWCIRPRVPKLDARTGRFRRVQTWIVLGRVDTMTKAEASKKADHFMATINDGRFVAAAQLEFVGVVAKYQEAKLPLLGSRTRDKYAAHIRNHILPAFGACRLADIDTQAVEAWLVGKRGELADATRADLLHVLSAIFSAAIKWRYWSGENPCTGVELGRIEPKREKRLLTIDEVQRFLAAIPDTRICSAQVARIIASTAIATGLRVSEILGLQWQDLDAEARSLSVRRRAGRGDVDRTKSARSRRKVEIDRLADDLLSLKPAGAAPDHFIFRRTEGGDLDDRDLQQHVFRPAAEAAGVYTEGFGLHWLRAQNITMRQHAGASSIEAMRAAGHSRIGVTALYTLPDSKREQQQVAAILEQIAPPQSGKPN